MPGPAFLRVINETVVFPTLITTGFPPFLTIQRGQSDANSAFIDLEPQAALRVVGLLTQFREFGCVFQQPLFQLGIVGVDLCGGSFAL